MDNAQKMAELNEALIASPHAPPLYQAKPESSPPKGPSLEKIALIVLGAVVLSLGTFLGGYELARSNDLAAEPADANSCAAASNATATAAFRMAQQDTWASIQSLSGTASVEEFLQCHGVSTAAGIRCSPSNPLLTPQNTIQLAFYQQGSTVSAIITATAPKYGGTVDTSDVEAFNVTIGIRGLDATGIDLNGPGSQMFPRIATSAQQHFEVTMSADDIRVGAIVLSWPASTNLAGAELYVASVLPAAMDFEVLGNTFTPVEMGVPTSEHPLVISNSGMPMPDVNVAAISMPAARRAAVDWAPGATNLTSSGSIEAKIGTTPGQEHGNALQTFSQQTGAHFEVLSDPRSGGDGNGAFINLTDSVTGRYAYLSFTHSQQLGDNITGTLNGSATMGVFTFDPSTGATTSSTTLLSDVGGASAGQRFGDPMPSWVTELMVQHQAEMSTELDLPPLNGTRGRRGLTRIILGEINSRIPCGEFSTTSRRACCACGKACLGAALSCSGCAMSIYSGNVFGAVRTCRGCARQIYHIGNTAQNCRVCIDSMI